MDVDERIGMTVHELLASPVATLDVASLASTNEVRLVVDVMASVFVRNPGSVVSLVPTITP